MKKYSQIKKSLNVDFEKDNKEYLASFTHYLQHAENGKKKFFKERAETYLSSKTALDDFNIKLFTPIKWDVPFPPNNEYNFTFIDLFAGIGGIRLGFQNAGGKCVFSSEWDNFARKTYFENFGEVPFGDIKQFTGENISDEDLNSLIPNHDILTAGFPCQPFSIAGVSKKNALGRQHGFNDPTQGTLFFDIKRIIDVKKPKAFLLENVKNLISHDKGRTFKIILESLDDELGYDVSYLVIDGKNYVPQHRERTYIVGFKKKTKFEFPIYNPSSKPKIKDILEKGDISKYVLTDHLWQYLQAYAEKHRLKGNGFQYGLVNLEHHSRTLSARYYKDGAEILIPINNSNPRRLSPRECARLMGYPDKFKIVVSQTQAYKQFGNSVVVPLIEDLAKSIAKHISGETQSVKNKNYNFIQGKKHEPSLY